jgi:hypothetical protein
VETTRAKSLPSPEDPLPFENLSNYCAKGRILSAFPSTDPTFLALPTLHSENVNFSAAI